MLQRFDTGPRMSEMTVHGGVCYLAGQIADDTSEDITGQTRQVLAEIDKLLAMAASDKTKILRAEIFLADIADFDGMNKAWDSGCRMASPRHAPPWKPSWRARSGRWRS